jgi:LAO/AO transport system kinase
MKKNKNRSALEEKEGILTSNSLNTASISKIKSNRKNQPSAEKLIKEILSGNKTALSRAITLVESTNQKHKQKANEIIEACLKQKSKTLRIGITGVPGVGKSTFIEAFGNHLISQGKKIAVLAIDPTSSISKGSILGDKTRMETLVKNDNAFIRPSPSGESLGGVARKTRETIILCEACGFDIILIETVGVGQSEVAVHSMVDFFLLLKIAGAGDELQGIKRGVIEMADCIAINKADGNNKEATRDAKVEFTRALHLFPLKKDGWLPIVLECSAINNNGIPEIWKTITYYLEETKSFFDEKRKSQNKYWLLQTIESNIVANFYNNKEVASKLPEIITKVTNQEISPFSAAEQLLAFHQKI